MGLIDRKTIDLKQLAKNLKSLREQANLSILGLHVLSGFSDDHLRQLEKSNNSVVPNSSTLFDLATIYNVKIDDLINEKEIFLGEKLSHLENFFSKNINSPNYLFDKNFLPSFIKIKVLKLPEMKSGMRVSEIIKAFPDKKLNSKDLSRELNRLYRKGEIERFDKTGKGSVFYFKLKTN
ncbi:helix-turn-helix domain-containing protein [Fontibacter flavus]|uniref:Helix-turn-helix domain-containing protein n=1 Tax=Fontibacter flavus TaxID=654838 RepID=A0ABV6FYA1_9BACT